MPLLQYLLKPKTPTKLFRRSLDLIKRNLDIDSLAVFFYNEGLDKFLPAVVTGATQNWFATHIPPQLLLQCYQKQEALRSNDLQQHWSAASPPMPNEATSGSCILLPLKEAGASQTYGVLCAYDPSKNAFTNYEYHVMSTISPGIVARLSGFSNAGKIDRTKNNTT